MEKFEKYNPDEETIEAWLKSFEIRLLCSNITAADRKRNWCRSLVGEAGNNVIEKLPNTATWSEIKAELCSVLGEGEPKRRAFENLSRYKPKSKRWGEMASDIMAQAAIATTDVELQTQLGLKAFLQAVPRTIGRELRRRHFNSVKEALEEARFLQSAEEEEDRDSGKICTVEAKAVPPVEEPKVNIQQIVEACVKQLQAQQPKKEQSERPRGSRKKYRCWCCREDGHTLRDCPTILQNRAAYSKQPTTEQAEKLNRSQDGTFVAPVLNKSSPLVTAEVTIAGVKVVALIDTGATSSCCRWGWYNQWKSHLGPLKQTTTLVIGVGNVPVELKGITDSLKLEWDSVVDHCEMMVLTTLEDVDVILGMDIINRLNVQIHGRSKDAFPQPESNSYEVLKLNHKVVIPAGKSRVFFVANTVTELTLFEPSDRLPEGLIGLPTLSEGSRVAVQLDNLTEGDITLNPEWEVGAISSVHLTQTPTGDQMPQIPDSLSFEQQRDLRRLLDEYKDVFSREGQPISSTSLVEHEIHTTGPAIRLPFRRQNPVIRDIEQQQVKEMLRDEVIRPSTSPWASPVVMVKKKDGTMRFCVDFRKMNDATIKDAHPLPRIDDTLESLHGAQYFTTLDLKSGYWQVPIKEEDKEKTAFRTSSGQLYEFNQLPFGLCNAPATFSRLMDRTLAGLAWNICLYYLDDIIVFSSTWAEHLERLRAVFERLRRANLKLGARKCHLAAREVSFLGYRVTPEGLEPEPRLMEAISKLPPPINVAEVRSFLGLVGYYRRFVKRFSDKAAPLNHLLHKDHPWKWTRECQEAFQTLKGEIASRPVSAYPDFSKPFRLYTDASNLGLGAILAQRQDGKERIICCASRTLNNAETNYSTTKKECLAVVWGVQVFRPFLVATHFEILTDHYALQWLRSMKSTSAILHRWAAALEDYRFTILHRPGKLQGHVDALSRLPTENLMFTLEGKIQVSEREAETVIKEVHRQGHLGENKTWKAFNRKYSTPQGRQKCREVVRTCPECQLGKDYKTKHNPKGHINSSGPWETVSIDIVGPLPVDGKSHRYIVTMMDVYSRYLIATPVKNHTASTVSRCLYESVVAYFGAPRSILSDRGTEFTGLVWESLAQLLGAKIKLTSPYYPQGNSVIERSHRTLSNMLRTMLLERKSEDWSTLLPSVMLYMNSMSQEKTGVSACEVLFGHNPNLPSDISYTPMTSLSNDREGYVKQLKRDLQDIRQKLSRILGHDRDQSINPFSVGDKVIIALLPQENTHKFMPKWKGPFLVTKVPNRFQIEYFDGSVTRLTHISYAKKFNERCLHTQKLRPLQVSCRRARDRMARLRLIFGSGHNKRKWIINSLDQIQRKWLIPLGRVRVRILGEEKDLPADLRELVEALDPDKCIEGGVLVDLCMQRSDRRGSGCDVPNMGKKLPRSADVSSRASKGFPTPLTSSLMHPKLLRTEVREDTWRKKEICMSIRLLKPSGSKKKRENHREGGEVRPSPLRYVKAMTSLPLSRQKAEGRNQQDFSYKYPKKSETDVIASIDQYKDSMQSVKPSGKQEERDANLSHLHQNDVMDDAINAERVELVASNSHTAPKRSCSYVKEDNCSLTNMIKSFFVQMACIFMVIENMIKSVISLNLLNLKRVVGLATRESVGWECCVIAISLSTNISYAFGGKRSYAYSSLNLVIYASWLRYFGRYIYNLDFEYATRGYCKLVYYYIRVFHSSQLMWNQATLSSEFATLFCNKLYTLVYLVSEWSFSGIINDDKYHRQFLFGLTLVCKAIMLNQCFLLHFYANWEELRPLVTSRAYGIKEGFNPCVIQKQFMRWYALVSLSPLSLLSLAILLCSVYYCCFYYYCYYFIITILYKLYLSLSLSSLLSFSFSPCHCGLHGAGVSPVYPDTLAYFSCYCELDGAGVSPVYIDAMVVFISNYLFPCYCDLHGAGVSPVYPDTLAYFKCYCELDGAGVSPVYIDAMVISYLKLFLFPCYCGLHGAGVSPVYPDTLAYFPCYCELDGAGVSPVYIDTVVFSRYLLSFLELSFAKHDDELLLAVGAFYKSKGLRIDGNSCLYFLSPPAPAPHSKCLGQSVARYTRPFESRPADPTRRVYYMRLISQPRSSGVIPTKSAVFSTPRNLERAEGPSSAHRKGFQCRRRLKF